MCLHKVFTQRLTAALLLVIKAPSAQIHAHNRGSANKRHKTLVFAMTQVSQANILGKRNQP